MISKNEIKSLRSLHQKKFRDEEKRFIAEGKNSVEEGLKSRYKCILLVYTDDFYSSNKEIINSAHEKGIRSEKTGEADFSRIADSVNPQGILAVFEIPEIRLPEFKNIHGPVVYLDNISDPGNTGTILRTSDWFGIKTVFLSRNSADIYNSKVVRSSAGSLFHLHIFRDTDLGDIAPSLKKNEYKVYAADLDGDNVFEFSFPSKSVLIFSNEANGLSENLLNYVDNKVSIPKFGTAESLNVASAAAVVLSQLRKK